MTACADQLTAQNHTLQTAAANADQVAQQLSTAQGDLAKLRAENTRLQQAGNGVAAASVAELTGLNEKLAGEKTALEKQLGQLKQASELSRAELTELKSRVTASDQAAQNQVATVNELSATNEKLAAQVKDLTAQLAALRAAGETATALRSELEGMKAKLADAQKAADAQGSTATELTGTNEKLSTDLKGLQSQMAALRAENAKLADAEQRAAGLSAAATQLSVAQRDLAALRAENTRLADSAQATECDRVARIAQLQQENAAINARLRQAQGTLDQIASAARLINGGA